MPLLYDEKISMKMRMWNEKNTLTHTLKDEVEKKMLSESRHSLYVEETLNMHISDVLKNMETDTDLF
jgi:hypothetical protein